MKIDVEKIIETLFFNESVRLKILTDFGITTQPVNLVEFKQDVIGALNQTPIFDDKPLELDYSNKEVFACAVDALGSNSRNWSTYLNSQLKLKELLFYYDYEEVYAEYIEYGDQFLEKVKRLLPGRSSNNDSRAIMKWAKLLVVNENYYGLIKNVAVATKKMTQRSYGDNDPRLLIEVVGFLAYPYKKWKPAQYFEYPVAAFNSVAFPGMGYILGSEFLRNLKWNGFKPDRHVQRLLSSWMPEEVKKCDAESNEICSLLGSKNRQLLDFVKFSLCGADACPVGWKASTVDNFVWLLGSYLEKKNKESKIVYTF